MKNIDHIARNTSHNWDLGQIQISHQVIDYHSYGRFTARNETEFVRLHFGLQGSYDFRFLQLNQSFSLSGHHNNIMYTRGLDLEIFNTSDRTETFGVNFTPDQFIGIGQHGNDVLKRFTEVVIEGKDSILSPVWRTNNFSIQRVIGEIIHCSYTNELRNLFLLSKSIELLVLQADLYEKRLDDPFIKSKKDHRRLIEAKELLTVRIDNPPTIVELSQLIGINEYKLKKGFKEVFGTTVFGYVHQHRMERAKRLLLETDQPAKEIAYTIGYSSPQHFSNAFKKEFGVSPIYVRKNPDSVIR